MSHIQAEERYQELMQWTSKKLKVHCNKNNIAGYSKRKKKWMAWKLVELDFPDQAHLFDPENEVDDETGDDHNHNHNHNVNENDNDNNDHIEEEMKEQQSERDPEQIPVFNFDISVENLGMKHSRYRLIIENAAQELGDTLYEDIIEFLKKKDVKFTESAIQKGYATVRGIAAPSKPVILSKIKGNKKRRVQWINNKRKNIEGRIQTIVKQFAGGSIVTLINLEPLLVGKSSRIRVAYLGEFMNAGDALIDALNVEISKFVDGFVKKKKEAATIMKTKANIIDEMRKELEELQKQRENMTEREYQQKQLEMYQRKMLTLTQSNDADDNDKEENDSDDDDEETDEEDEELSDSSSGDDD